MSPKRIGVLTSGGDCPGLNAVLRGVYSTATELGWEVLGFRDGFEGMLSEGGDIMVLNRENTSGIMQIGGTILGTTNKGHFTSKIAAGERSMIPEEVIAKASKTCRELKISDGKRAFFMGNALVVDVVRNIMESLSKAAFGRG